jgi:type IV secretory pathway VirJ component
VRRATPLAPLAAILCVVSAATAAPAATVKAPTSRGERELLVFAPPAGADDAKPVILFVSGEGGWRRFDDLVTGYLAGLGYWVGGVNAMDYFWDAQDDRQALAGDFRAYASALAKAAGRMPEAPLVLAGFSFGADMAPWLAGAGGWAERLRGLLMIGPDETGSLEFRLAEILGFESKDHIFSVAEALRGAAGVPVAFVHGEKDSSSAAVSLSRGAGEPKKLIVVAESDHHFSGHEADLRSALADAMTWIAGKPKRD